MIYIDLLKDFRDIPFIFGHAESHRFLITAHVNKPTVIGVGGHLVYTPPITSAYWHTAVY